MLRKGLCVAVAASSALFGFAGSALAAGTWTGAASMSVTRFGHASAALPGGKVLVATGSTTSGFTTSAEIYDSASNSWSGAASMNTGRYSPAAATLADGRVLVAGGYNNSGRLRSAEIYDPVANAWSAAADMSSDRYGGAAATLPNGRVLVAGGSGPGLLKTAEIYDPVANAWSPAASMQTARDLSAAAALPDGRVLVSGGRGDAVPTLTSAEIYDPVANSWSPAASMGTARQVLAAASLPGKVLVAGGYTPGASPGSLSPTATAEEYDPASNSWTPVQNMSRGRVGLAAAVLPGGRVLASGGPDNTTEIYAQAATVTGAGTTTPIGAGPANQFSISGVSQGGTLTFTSAASTFTGTIQCVNIVGSSATIVAVDAVTGKANRTMVQDNGATGDKLVNTLFDPAALSAKSRAKAMECIAPNLDRLAAAPALAGDAIQITGGTTPTAR